MYCDNCGAELADDAGFCSKCGNKIGAKKHKNIYIAILLTFIFAGLGSIYAGNIKKGVILLGARFIFSLLGGLWNIFFIIALLVWAFSFYEAYRDVQIANGRSNPKLLNDFPTWDQKNKIIAVIIIVVVVALVSIASVGTLAYDSYSPSDSGTHYYTSSSQSSGGSSHYGGVDDSPHTIAKNDPDWYYEHYDYGDNPDIDDYLESEGYD